MNKTLLTVVYAIVMVGLIVGVDLAFLRDDAVLRLFVNLGIVLLFGVGYFAVIRRM